MRRSLNLVLLVFVIVAGLFIGGCGNDTKQFTLTIHVQGEGSVEPAEGKHRFDPKAVVDLVATPSIGWSFKEWIGEVTDTGAATTTVLMEGDKEVIALFEFPAVEGPPPGEQTSHTANGINFNMRLVPASTFPIGTDDSGSATVDHNFWVAETLVTYELWYEVRQWALDNGYTFANAGMEGSTTGGGTNPNFRNIGNPPTSMRNEPVTMVSWRDSIVWTNALSEMLGFTPVYTYQGNVIRDSTNATACDNAVQEDTNGFRLPTSMEWELAARYKGRDGSHGAIEYPFRSRRYWTPGNYASGATGPAWNPTDEEATQAAGWYNENSERKTQDVGQKPSEGNGVGVFDMSGNVSEWCFTLSGSMRVTRGGCWLSSAHYLRVGFVESRGPVFVNRSFGLRFLRTHF